MEKILSSAMATEKINEVIAKRNEMASQIIEKRSEFENAEVETREQIINDVEKLSKEVEEMDNQVKELEEVKDTLEDQEQRMSLMNNVSTEKVEQRAVVETKSNSIADSKEYRSALETFYKTGKDMQLRAILTSQDNLPIPTVMQREIEVAWQEYGNLVNLCSVVSARAIMAVTLELTATGATWHDEGTDAPAEEQITFGEILLNPKFLKKWISLSDEVILLTGDMFLRYIAREMVYRLSLALNAAIVNRTDATGKGVIGIVGNPNAQNITAALTFNTPNAAMAQLRTWDNVRVVLNPQTFFNNVLGLTDLQQRPIYQIMNDNAGRPRYYYAGLPVEFTDALPAYDAATANQAYMIVGNFVGYKLNLPYGRNPELIYDRITQAREDKEVITGKLPAAGNITKQGFFVVVNKAA